MGELTQLVEEWIEDGWNKGLQKGLKDGRRQGLQQGRQEGKSDLVLRLLNRRVGLLSKRWEKRVRALTVEQLENLGEALLDFQSRADLERWFQEQPGKPASADR